MLEIERRRLQLNISMQEVCDRSGVADYYYSKALHASTPSGREARWSTIQDIVDAIFPEGYDVVIKPKVGLRLDAEQLRCKIKFAAAAFSDRKAQRKIMRALGKKGGESRREKYKTMTKEERQRIAKKARKTRRQNRLLRAQMRKPQPEIRSPL
jgi:transcriptional regulator with XRE-family HTH domain